MNISQWRQIKKPPYKLTPPPHIHITISILKYIILQIIFHMYFTYFSSISLLDFFRQILLFLKINFTNFFKEPGFRFIFCSFLLYFCFQIPKLCFVLWNHFSYVSFLTFLHQLLNFFIFILFFLKIKKTYFSFVLSSKHYFVHLTKF